MNPSMWSGKCNLVMAETSPVNIGAASVLDAPTRTLTITVELYYTESSTSPSNFINVALIQNSIYGPQTNGGAGNNYLHMHMLRHLVTGQWGDEIYTTTQGSLVSRTYTYVVPEDYNAVPAIVSNMKVVAFVAESHQEVYTATEVNAIGENTAIGSITTTEPLIKKGAVGVETNFIVEANSAIEGSAAFELNIETTDAPEN